MNFRKEMHEEAVSPVIGVILMVAITVVLAATIAMFAFSSTDKIETSKIVSLQSSVSVSDDGSEYVSITVQGGADLSELTALKFTWDGKAAVADDATAGFKMNGASKTLSEGALKSTFAVGDTITLKKDGKILKVIGKFADGSDQMLYDKKYA